MIGTKVIAMAKTMMTEALASTCLIWRTADTVRS